MHKPDSTTESAPQNTPIALAQPISLALPSLCEKCPLASFVVRFLIKLNQEERLLLRSFPHEYSAYKARVKALIPYMF
jgi:protein-S-isoprenylcysteine O-methyltransferase Ste14